MEKNDKKKKKTIADVKPYTGGEKSEDDIKDFVEKNLKK